MTFNELMTAVVTNGIGAACALAVLWFAYYRETKTIPKMMTDFTTALNKSNETDITRNDKVLETFAQVIREERTTCQKWHEENRTRLDQLVLETRENRHLIRDLAHTLGLRNAVEAEQAKAKGIRRGEDVTDIKGVDDV